MTKKKQTRKEDTTKKSERILRSNKRREEEESNLSASNDNDSDDSKQEEEEVESEIEANVSKENNNNNNNNNITTMATFDSALEAIFKTTLEKDLTHPVALAFQHDGIDTFEDFLLYTKEEISELSYVDPKDSSNLINLNKIMCRLVSGLRYYCDYLETTNHPQAMNPTDTSTTVWTLVVFKSWMRTGLASYLANANISTATQPGYSVNNNSGATAITQEKKDADALTGWRRKPTDTSGLSGTTRDGDSEGEVERTLTVNGDKTESDAVAAIAAAAAAVATIGATTDSAAAEAAANNVVAAAAADVVAAVATFDVTADAIAATAANYAVTAAEAAIIDVHAFKPDAAADNNFDHGRSAASTLDTVHGEYRTGDNIDSDAILILTQKVPPDLYERDNPASDQRFVDDAILRNDRVESFGMKVTTPSALHVAAPTQNATFEDDDPHSGVANDSASKSLATTRTINPEDDNLRIDVGNDFIPDSLLSVYGKAEQNLEASIGDLILSLSTDNSTEIEKDVAAATAMKPLLTDCKIPPDPVEEKTIGNSLDPPRSNVLSVSIVLSNVAAAAAMAPISATADKADDYKAAAVTDRAPVVPTAAAAAMTVTFDRDDIADLKLFWKDDDIAEVLSCEDVPTSPIPLDDAAADPKVIWKEPIDDANGEKHVSQRLRKSRRKRRTRAAKRREKKALQELKQQKDIDLLPALQIRNDDDSSDDDDSDLEPNLLPALMDRNNEDSSGDEESDFEVENNRVLNVADKSHPVTKPDPSPGIGHISNPVPDGVPSIDTKVELTSLDNDVDPDISPFSTYDATFVDINPDSTGTIVEQDGVLYMERQLGDDVYYQPLDVYENPNKTIDFISEGSQYWTLCNDAPALNQQSNVIVDTEFDSTYLDNLDVPRPTEHEFFDDWLLDDPTLRLLTQGCLDDCAEYNVSASDLSQVINPLSPRMSKATKIDYESKRKYFAHLPASIVEATFKHTT